jgi:hypothetical protein
VRVSVRGLIALVLVVGGWLGWIVRGARVQREAVAGIQKAGGSVRYDWQIVEGHWIRGKLWAPRWLVDLIGIDYFGHVTGVDFRRDATDEKLALVTRLDRVERLHSAGDRVTDAGLVHLEGLTNISFLDLQNTRVSDAGLIHLKGLAKLS